MSAAGHRRVCGTLVHLGSERADMVHGEFRIETFFDLSSRSHSFLRRWHATSERHALGELALSVPIED